MAGDPIPGPKSIRIHPDPFWMYDNTRWRMLWDMSEDMNVFKIQKCWFHQELISIYFLAFLVNQMGRFLFLHIKPAIKLSYISFMWPSTFLYGLWRQMPLLRPSKLLWLMQIKAECVFRRAGDIESMVSGFQQFWLQGTEFLFGYNFGCWQRHNFHWL